MKKTITLMLVVITALLVSSCFQGTTGLTSNTVEIADTTFNNLITAIKSKDNDEIFEMFAESVRTVEGFDENVIALIQYIKGDVVSFSSAIEKSVSASKRTEKGKKIHSVTSSFSIKTTEKEYFIAVKECVRDDFARSNIGLTSLYIIEAEEWNEFGAYLGDGLWTPGINIRGQGDGSVVPTDNS